MKFLRWLPLALIALNFPLTALAQVPGSAENPTIINTSTSRLIPPRFSVDYNSSGGGYDGFGGLEFLLPVQQEPGQRLDYLLGRLNVSNGADVGGNLLFGTRNLNKCWVGSGNCFIGGYVGLDLTNTGEALFPQLGLGLEMLGNVELRLNGYLPLGDSRRQVTIGRFAIPTDVQFQGNNLLFLDRNNLNRFQNALSGFDLEVGGKIAQLGQGGDLRGYGGVYSYEGDGVERYWGGRFRLEARPNDVLSIGAGVQFDREFGTNLLFRVAASFPSLAQRQSRAGNPSLEQLAQPPLRQNSVVVAQRAEPARGPIALDPIAGKPYEFIHVSPSQGSESGSGTIEAPTNTVQAATVLATPTTDVIYVQPGNGGGGFTIPDGVAVLSVVPVQVIATQLGQVQLPGSGQGEVGRPVISDTVTMGNDTKLSGFAIQPPENRLGVVAENGGNIEIADNTITTVGNFSNGIITRGNLVTILNNTITTTGDFSASIIGINGNSKVVISNNTVVATGNQAVAIDASGIFGGDSGVTISDNNINTIGSNSNGIRLVNLSEGSVAITGNIIQEFGENGVELDLSSYFPEQPTFCTILANNTSQTSGNGTGFRLTNSVGGTFQIVDSSPVFANTQANNIGTFVFEPSITSFTNVPTCP